MLQFIFLQAQPGGNPLLSMLFPFLILIVFYFFLIRPQMKRAKEQRKFQEAVKIGDRIVTTGGIHGEIIEVDETTVAIKLDQGRMRIEKAALNPERTVTEGQNK